MTPARLCAIVRPMTTHFDLPLAELRDYRPDLAEPADLREFWQTTLDEAHAHDIDVT